MKYILIFFLLISTAYGQTTNFTQTIIPRTTEFVAPARGAEVWHNEQSGNIINNISESQYSRPLDVYQRSFLTWDALEVDSNNYTLYFYDTTWKVLSIQ